MSASRRTVDQRPQVTFGPRNGKILQEVAPGIHEGHDDAGQVLAKRERTGHRHKGDGVDS